MNSPDRWRLVERLYHEALAREGSARATFLRDACAGDETLRIQVESLIAYAGRARDFLAAPATEGVPPAALVSAEPAKRLIGVHLGPYHVEALLGVGGTSSQEACCSR